MCNDFLDVNDIKSKKRGHFNFFADYFDKSKGGHDAKTIVVENKYLSKSYLEDYSNFYSTCYVDYRRFCKRIHIFSKEFKEKEFVDIVTNKKADNLEIWSSYLGYIVIRPLSDAAVGATLLKTFNEDGTGRHYPATRNYKINLFGKQRELKTLVFQEQDAVVGACASSALWSAFHKVSTDEIFQTPLPSPSEITKSVKTHFNDFSGRIFPNAGLTIEQICEAIDSIGLVSELYNDDSIKNTTRLKSILYSYCKMGLPVLLAIKLENDGYHLITIVGYRVDPEKVLVRKSDDMVMFSDKICKFYAHDDQVGPFSRLEFYDGTKSHQYQLKTSWINYEEQTRDNEYIKLLASPESIVIPLHDQIRITYNDIYQKINVINRILKFFIEKNVIEWDIHLSFSNRYKEELLENNEVSSRIRKKILLRCLPKYIWTARANVGGALFAEFIFDATNTTYSSFCKFANFYNEDLRSEISSSINNITTGFSELVLEHLGKKYLEIIKDDVF